MLGVSVGGEGGVCAVTANPASVESSNSVIHQRNIDNTTSTPSSTSGSLKASPQNSNPGSRWKNLFRGNKACGKPPSNEHNPEHRPQAHHGVWAVDSVSGTLFGGIGELRRRFLRYHRKGDIDGEDLGRATPHARATSAATDPTGRRRSTPNEGVLLTARSVRFGPAEVREFSPYRSSCSPRRASTDVYGFEEDDGPEDIPGQGRQRGSRPLGFGRVAQPSRMVTQEERMSSVEEDCDGVPRFLRRDLAAAACAAAMASTPSRVVQASEGSQFLPTGLTLDQAITFGHGQFASRTLSSPINSDSQAMEEFLRATDSDPAVAKVAEEVVTGWCA